MKSLAVLSEGLPVPHPGRILAYDELHGKIERIKLGLDKELSKIKGILNVEEIKYVHARQRFEIEIEEDQFPENYDKKLFFITSRRKGFVRVHTMEIEKAVKILTQLESELHKVLVPFVTNYFKQFYLKNDIWTQTVCCLSELDCLCSLAKFSSKLSPKCKPNFIKSSVFDPQTFKIEGMVHPILNSEFQMIPNDVSILDEKNIFLITGPNMGGKSTLLRSVCISTILAQIGCYVPAKSFTLSPFDRIFTRLGGNDSLVEKKSTFYVEMEETLNIVKEASERSLIVIDELGRGTSTYDGVSLAFGVLKFLAEEIKGVTFFATHYHLLLEEMELYSNIGKWFMGCEVEGDEVVKFLYKF